VRCPLCCALLALWPVAAAAAPDPLPKPPVVDARTAAEQLQTQLEVIDAMLDAGLTENAIQLCADLRAAGVEDSALELLQARAWHLRGMSGEAQVLLEQLLKRQPRNAEAWAMLGVVQADRHDPAAARESLERAHQLAPEDPEILNNLGFVLLSAGDAEGAIERLRRSLQIDPSQLRTRNNLAFALARAERDTEALELFRSAGNEADARYNMGVACELRMDRASAIVHYQAAISASPGYLPAVTALKRLIHQEIP